MFGVWTNPWVTQTTQDKKFGIVWERTKEIFVWIRRLECGSKHAINEVHGSGKGIGSIGER